MTRLQPLPEPVAVGVTPPPGTTFPGLELPDHTGRRRRLSEIAGGDPLVLVTSRGWWCPKEQRYLRNLVAFQDELEVAYSRLAVLGVDPPEVSAAFRAGLGARFLFLFDSDRSWLDELGLREVTDTVHHPYRPAAFTLFPDLRVHTAYNGWAHVCALPDEDAALPFDDASVQEARRDALAWWIPLLGDSLVCLTTLAVDSVRYGGAVTVANHPGAFVDDPFARIFPGKLVRSDLFARVPAPPGPAIERYSGAPWPGGSFATGGTP